VNDGLEDDLRADRGFERRLFLRGIVILLVVLAALVLRALAL
jgi:hypothetical protein